MLFPLEIFRNKSLRLRINASILIVCFFVAILTMVTVVPYEKKRIQALHNNIEVLLKAVYQQKREALANEIFAGQMVALENSIQDIQKVEQISRVELYQLDGQLLLTSHDEPTQPLPESLRTELIKAPTFSRQIVSNEPYAVFESLIEIIGEKVGYIRIFYDLGNLERELYVVASLGVGLLLTLLISGGLFANRILSHAIIQPAAKLSKAIQKVREGGLGEQVDIESGDEIGSMAADFNDMSRRLFQKNEELLEAIEEKDTYAKKLTQINQKLETLNVELEERVEERTAELQDMYEQLRREMSERLQADKEKKHLQEKLLRSQKMEALGLLAGGVAHDLNNVLSGIVSYPDLILHQLEEGSALKKPIQTIQRSGLKAAAIVEDLLALTRRGVVTKEVINLNWVVSFYLQSPEYTELLKHHPGVKVKVDLSDDLLPLLGSTIHITKIIMNLVSNAAEAQPAGGFITIKTANRYQDESHQKHGWVKEGEYALLQVSDGGSGIASDDLDRIFEPFYTKKVLGRSGTGLGMTVVWGAVQDHDGYIDVKSVLEKGTTFELFFPVTRQAIESVTTTTSLADLQGNGEYVLIVDDVEEQRDISMAILTHLNYTAVAVESGEAALEYLGDKRVDLVILDMIMEPGIDGLETYRRMKEMLPLQKAIIASGYSENERVREAINLGVGAYIRKPFTLERLGHVLRSELCKTA